MYGPGQYDVNEQLDQVAPNRHRNAAINDAVGLGVVGYGLYQSHRESVQHEAWVDSLPPQAQAAYYARRTEVRAHGAIVLLIGVIILAVGIIGGHHLPGNGAVFNLVGIGLAFVGFARATGGRGD